MRSHLLLAGLPGLEQNDALAVHAVAAVGVFRARLIHDSTADGARTENPGSVIAPTFGVDGTLAVSS